MIIFQKNVDIIIIETRIKLLYNDWELAINGELPYKIEPLK